jgi:hypothetical protein
LLWSVRSPAEALLGRIFQGFTEGKITFKPTYRYLVGTDQYDRKPEGKMRCPSWCDRILFKLNPPLYQRRLGEEEQQQEEGEDLQQGQQLEVTITLSFGVTHSLTPHLNDNHLHSLPPAGLLVMPQQMVLEMSKLTLATLGEEEATNESPVGSNGPEVFLV